MKNNTIIAILFSLMLAAVFAGTSGPAPVPSPPGYNLTVPSPELCRGTVNYVPISITNLARNANIAGMQSVQLSVVNSKAVSSGTLNVGTVAANTTKIAYLPVFVSQNASSFINVGIFLYYYYYTDYTDSELQNFTFQVKPCQLPISIMLSPQIVQAGEIQNLSVNLTNTGSTTLNSILLSTFIPATDGVVLNTGPIDINSIAPNATVHSNLKVLIYSTAAAAFIANITGSYYVGTNLQEISNNTELLSTGLINITPSSVTISPSLPTAGSVFSASLILTNIGSASASAVTATELPTKGFSSFGSPSSFVGDISSDSQTSVTLTYTANRTMTPGKYILPIRLSYLNSLRYNVSQIIKVPVTILSPSLNSTPGGAVRYSSGGGAGGFIILILIIVIIALVVLLYKEKKKRHVK